jgi:hypothetical protein
MNNYNNALKNKNGLWCSVTSLTLSLLGFLILLFGLGLGFYIEIFGLVFGVISLTKGYAGKRLAWTGIVIFILSMFLSTILSIYLPKIEEIKDRTIIEQTIGSLGVLNDNVLETMSSVGTTRGVVLSVKKGEYVIDSKNNIIYYILRDSDYIYSPINKTTQVSPGINTITSSSNEKYNIFLILNYSSYDLTYNDQEIEKVLTPNLAGYNFIIENKGRVKLNFKLVN